jgi:hypothetical protein
MWETYRALFLLACFVNAPGRADFIFLSEFVNETVGFQSVCDDLDTERNQNGTMSLSGL